jgi:3-dehydroquinate synthase
MSSFTRIEVQAAGGPYPVVVGHGVSARLSDWLDTAGLTGRATVVSSPTVWEAQGRRISRALKGRMAPPILVPDGERSKNMPTVGRIHNALVESHADRSSIIVAVGGGVLGDMAGFAASTYLRGVRVAHVPTTLMAQVDSAVGGKTGVNHPLGKNLIGAFHAPRLVVADPQLLDTLPRRQFRAGLYEVIKYGAISTPALLEQVVRAHGSAFGDSPEGLDAIVAESCRIKAVIVSGDEREGGPRRVLNFGHTLGHALESATAYRRLLHGEAVGYGMLAAAALGERRGVTPPSTAAALRSAIEHLGPLPSIGDLSAREVARGAAHDKKVIGGRLHFVAVTALGRTRELTDVTTRELVAALRSLGLRP